MTDISSSADSSLSCSSSETANGPRSLPDLSQQDSCKLRPHSSLPSSGRPQPVSSRAYNRKDYEYISSFFSGRNASMTPFNRRTSHRVSHTHGTDEGKELSAPSSKHHVSLPEFGSWDVDTSSSSEGYTKAFDHARGLKKELVRSHQLPRNDFQQIVSEGDSKP